MELKAEEKDTETRLIVTPSQNLTDVFNVSYNIISTNGVLVNVRLDEFTDFTKFKEFIISFKAFTIGGMLPQFQDEQIIETH